MYNINILNFSWYDKSISFRWTIQQYPSGLYYHILYRTIEMLNHKTKSKLFLLWLLLYNGLTASLYPNCLIHGEGIIVIISCGIHIILQSYNITVSLVTTTLTKLKVYYIVYWTCFVYHLPDIRSSNTSASTRPWPSSHQLWASAPRIWPDSQSCFSSSFSPSPSSDIFYLAVSCRPIAALRTACESWTNMEHWWV